MPFSFQPLGGRKPNKPGPPVAPNKKDKNRNRYTALKNLYDQNKSAYDKAKSGQKYVTKSVATGGGYTKTDFGEGKKGAAIPWTTKSEEHVKIGGPGKKPNFPKPKTKQEQRSAAIQRRLGNG